MANLSEMSNEQREQHRIAVCVALGLDPDPRLGNLNYAWMPAENGMKNLVLYARRGAVEQLREINGVDIKSLDQYDSPGYVSFKATAVNKKGRQEIAYGSHETDGLKGKKLADAVMTASTRALRRVTLQFAGYGILDETEINTQPTAVITPESSLAQLAGSPVVMPPPQVAPSQAPGKDITPAPAGTVSHIEKVYADGAIGIKTWEAAKPPVGPIVMADTEAAKTSAVLEPLVAQNPSNQGVLLQDTAAKQADIQADPAPKRGRPRKKRGQVDISSPGQQIEMPAGRIDAAGNITPVSVPLATVNDTKGGATGNRSDNTPLSPNSVPLATTNDTEWGVNGNDAALPPALAEPTGAVAEHLKGSITIAKIANAVLPQAKTEYHAAFPPHVGNAVVVVPDPSLQNVPIQVSVAGQPQVDSALPNPIDKAKQDAYKVRLRKYANEILPGGGMVPTDTIGGINTKLRKFAELQAGTEAAKLTEELYEDLFNFLDGFLAEHGAPALVAYIDKSLGVIK
jgi:hypothetical protein